MAECITSFFETVADPGLIYKTTSFVPLLFNWEIGGNSVTRWIAFFSEKDLESESSTWAFKVLGNARSIENIPITNTKHVVLNRKREWVTLC